MKPSTKNKVEGAAKVASGQLKQAVAKVVNSPLLKTEGIAEEAVGKVQKAAGALEDIVGK